MSVVFLRGRVWKCLLNAFLKLELGSAKVEGLQWRTQWKPDVRPCAETVIRVVQKPKSCRWPKPWCSLEGVQEETYRITESHNRWCVCASCSAISGIFGNPFCTFKCSRKSHFPVQCCWVTSRHWTSRMRYGPTELAEILTVP